MWDEAKDAQGRTYYYHTVQTDRVQWTRKSETLHLDAPQCWPRSPTPSRQRRHLSLPSPLQNNSSHHTAPDGYVSKPQGMGGGGMPAVSDTSGTRRSSAPRRAVCDLAPRAAALPCSASRVNLFPFPTRRPISTFTVFSSHSALIFPRLPAVALLHTVLAATPQLTLARRALTHHNATSKTPLTGTPPHPAAVSLFALNSHYFYPSHWSSSSSCTCCLYTLFALNSHYSHYYLYRSSFKHPGQPNGPQPKPSSLQRGGSQRAVESGRMERNDNGEAYFVPDEVRARRRTMEQQER